jgi:putative membrane protein
MKLFFARWAINVLAMWLTAMIVSGFRFDTVPTLLIAGLVFGLVNAIVRPILLVLTLPLTVVTLGLFVLVLNALMLLLVAWLVPGFHIAGFWTAVGSAILISFISYITNRFIGEPS